MLFSFAALAKLPRLLVTMRESFSIAALAVMPELFGHAGGALRVLFSIAAVGIP